MDDTELEISQPGKSRTPLPLQNSYAAKKTAVQGLMDVALVMANANQLRFVIEYSYDTRTYYLVFSLLVASLVLQVPLFASRLSKPKNNVYNTIFKHEII